MFVDFLGIVVVIRATFDFKKKPLLHAYISAPTVLVPFSRNYIAFISSSTLEN